MILYSKRHVNIAELHFNEGGQIPAGIDVVRFQSRPERVPGTYTHLFHTIVMDLDGDSEQLLSRMHRTTSHHIRKVIGRKDIGFELDAAPDVCWAQEFITLFDRFARQKNLPCANRQRILGMQAGGALILSRVTGADGSPLVWHSYVRAGNWARAVHSASLFREADKAQAAMISRANRYRHWLDMIRLGDIGVELYDFGGWYIGKQDHAKLRINQFKEGFGGRILELFNTDHGVTWKGVIAIQARRAINRLRGES